MSLTQLPPLDPSSQTFKADVDAFFRGKIQNFVNEVNALQANLNSIAAGGAYAIPFRFTNNTANVTTGSWLCLASPTSMTFDGLDARGADTTARLNNLFSGSTSSIKAQLTIYAQGDPSRWMQYNVAAYSQFGAYGTATVQIVASSGTFAEGESIVVQFQRTGDKGDTGAAAINPSAKFSDRKSSGVSGGTNVTGEQTRTLNTTDYNTAGVTLSGNQVTIQPGTYEIQGRAPAHAVGYHRASLYNVTDGTPALVGSSEYASPAGGVQSSSAFMGRIVLATAKTFSVRHYTGQATTSTGLGNAVSVSGVNETYTELSITKVA